MRPSSSKRKGKPSNIEIEKTRPKSAIIRYPVITEPKNVKNSNEKSNNNISKKLENNKNPKIFPQKVEKEHLYEDTVLLKIEINTLRKKLDEAKTLIYQKNNEIKQKKKIIEDCIRDNDIDSVHKENLEKGKESTFITLYKNQYYEFKKLFKKKSEENDILKAHIKITKIKELENNYCKLEKELENLKNLFLFSQEKIQNDNFEIDNLQDFKNKFQEQHILLNSIKNNCEQLNKDNKNLKDKINKLNDKIQKNQKEKKKLKTINMKLKFNNDKFLNEKKQREYILMNEKNNEKKIIELKEKLDKYKDLYKSKSNEIERLNPKEKEKTKDNNILNKDIIIDNKKPIFNNSEEKKKELIKKLLDDALIKVKIYENYINQNKNYNLSKILSQNGYNNGLMTSNSPPLNLFNSKIPNQTKSDSKLSENNNIRKSEINNENNRKSEIINENNRKNEINNENNRKNEINNENNRKNEINNENNNIRESEIKNENNNSRESELSEDNNVRKSKLSGENKMEFTKKSDIYKETYLKKEIQEENILNINNNKIEEAKPINYNNEIELSLPYIIVKNLESKHIKANYLNDEVNKITQVFQNANAEEISRDDFIEPFRKLLIESMKIKNENDILIINTYLDNLLTKYNNDTDDFMSDINNIFSNVNDYSLINEEEFNSKLKIQINNYPNLIDKCKEVDSNKNYIISYFDYKKIYSDLKLDFDDNLNDYLIYKMKLNTPENSSFFDLNYQFIEDLVKNKGNYISKIPEEEHVEKESSDIDIDAILKSSIEQNSEEKKEHFNDGNYEEVKNNDNEEAEKDSKEEENNQDDFPQTENDNNEEENNQNDYSEIC